MILGLIAVPIFGFGMELYSAHDRMSLLTQGEPLSCQYPDEGEWHACGDTVIHHQWLVVVWATVTVLVAVADRRYRQPTLKGP
jgi:hypothetical protein